jgi:hypothetical protein
MCHRRSGRAVSPKPRLIEELARIEANKVYGSIHATAQHKVFFFLSLLQIQAGVIILIVVSED